MADLTEAIEAARRETGTSTLARIAVEAAAPIIERQIRAEVAEGIARAIEALGDRGYGMYRRTIDEAARIARGYTQPAETPGHRDGTPAAPVQPT